MPRDPNQEPLPVTYHGKEAAYIKHELLKAYLKRLFLIIGMAANRLGFDELCYVDCFAGPWQDESDGLKTTSIAISLRILDECRQELVRQGRPVRIRALYVEQDKAAFERLRMFLGDHTPSGVTTNALHGDFVALRHDVLEWCGQRAFAFFFIDPTGWNEVKVNVLEPLLNRPRSEFLINFMFDFLNRAVSMADFQNHMVMLLGERPDVEGLSGLAREHRILETYRRNLKRHMSAGPRGAAWSAYVRVLDRTKDRTKYHLVYLTTHPKGITVFMGISEKLDAVQKLVRASTKQRKRIDRTGQDELFSAGETQLPDDHTVDISEVESAWLTRLSLEPKRFDEAEYARLLEETDCFPRDLQTALGNLIEAGKVRNLDAQKKRRTKFLHFEGHGERLQLVKDSEQ